MTTASPAPVVRTVADQTKGFGVWRGFLAAAHRTGLQPFTVALDVSDVPAPAEVAERMGVPDGATVLRRIRLQGHIDADGGEIPYLLSTAWIDAAVADQVPALRRPPGVFVGVRTELELAGFQLRYKETITARHPLDGDDSELNLLDLGAVAPVLEMWRVCADQYGTVVDVTRVVANPAYVTVEFVYP